MATHDQTYFGRDGTPLVIRVTGQGPPMVFLHGSNGGLDSWAEIAAGIPDHSAWLMARRGTGPVGSRRSGTPPRARRRTCCSSCGPAAEATDGTDVTRWSTIDVPVLLMQGADTWAPLSTGMTELPSARRVVWAGQSHVATSTAPHLVADALRQFVVDVER